MKNKRLNWFKNRLEIVFRNKRDFKDISIYLAFSENPNVFLKFFFKSKKLLKWQKKKGEYYLYSYEGNSLDELINDEELLDFIDTSQSSDLKESVRVYCMIKNEETN